MRLTTLTLAAVIALIGATAAEPVPPVRSYAPVTVTPPEAFEDASFETFRHELAAVARARIYSELTRLVSTQGFFWERDFEQGFDPRRATVDNLAAAIRLEHGAGEGWQTLAAFAAETSAAPLPSRLGVLCAPRQPRFDEVEFAWLIRQTGIEARAWAYARAERTTLRVAPAATAAAIDTLGRMFVRLLAASDGIGAAADRVPMLGATQWFAVAAPNGKTGFVSPGALLSLASPRLCYHKDAIGQWRIAGFIGPGD